MQMRNLDGIVHLEMTLERMKAQIVQCFNAEHLSDQIRVAAERAVDNFDFQAAVEKEVSNILVKSINHYFQYGDGEQAIRQASTQALGRLLNREGAKDPCVGCGETEGLYISKSGVKFCYECVKCLAVELPEAEKNHH